MKILIIGPSWVGDMVMSQSLYISLKQQFPHATIDVMAPAWCRPILERMPEVNQALEMPIGHGSFNLKGRFQLGRKLRNSGYTHAYILPNSAKSALIPIFAGISSRTGWKGESRYGLLNDIRTNKKDFGLMVERYCALAYPKESMINSQSLNNIPYPSLEVNHDAQQASIQKLHLDSQRPVIGMCPGAEFGPSKRWPEKYFATVANKMIEQGYQVWLFGSEKDNQVTSLIHEKINGNVHTHCYNLAGKTNLIEALDLLANCEIVVSNDSGLMHIAAAVGCKVVAVYGSTSPDYTPPLSNTVEIIHTDIDCRPCFKRECPYSHQKCLTELYPQQVINAIEVLNNKS